MEKKILIATVSIIALLVIGGVVYYLLSDDEFEYIQISPTTINSDDELVNFVELHEFSGDGTSDNPYLIKNIEISNITDVSLKIHNTRSHVIIEDSIMYNAELQNIWLWNVRNIIIRNNQFYNGSGDAIYINSSSDVIVEENRIWGIDAISNGYYNGLANFAVAIDVQYSTRVEVRNNHIFETYDGIWFWGYNNNSIIEGNRIENLSTHGLGFGGPDNFGINVINNYIRDITYAMWLLGPLGNSLIEGNTVIDAFDGIRTFTRNLTISDNYFGDISNYGIYMQYSSGFPDRSQGYNISNNTFEGVAREGVYLEGATVSDNIIIDNNFIDINLRYPGDPAIKDNGHNNWIERNYYSNFTGVDQDTDGYYDTPYEFSGSANNQDEKPRVEAISFTKIE